MIIFVFIGELHDGHPWKLWLAKNEEKKMNLYFVGILGSIFCGSTI